MKNFDINFTEHEAYQLQECLSNLRKKIDQEYEFAGGNNRAINDPIFRSACEMQFKIDKAIRPDSDVTLDDYLDYGK